MAARLERAPSWAPPNARTRPRPRPRPRLTRRSATYLNWSTLAASQPLGRQRRLARPLGAREPAERIFLAAGRPLAGAPSLRAPEWGLKNDLLLDGPTCRCGRRTERCQRAPFRSPLDRGAAELRDGGRRSRRTFVALPSELARLSLAALRLSHCLSSGACPCVSSTQAAPLNAPVGPHDASLGRALPPARLAVDCAAARDCAIERAPLTSQLNPQNLGPIIELPS